MVNRLVERGTSRSMVHTDVCVFVCVCGYGERSVMRNPPHQNLKDHSR